MDSSFWLDTINLVWSIVYIKEPQVIISKEYSMEMVHYTAFHLALLFAKDTFRELTVYKGLSNVLEIPFKFVLMLYIPVHNFSVM